MNCRVASNRADLRIMTLGEYSQGLALNTKNARAERAIQTIMYMAQTFMVHASLHWTDRGSDDLSLGSFVVKHSVWWLGYEKAMTGYPKTFRTFVTKQVSGWCGCNSKLSLWEKGVDSKCPQCGCEHENSKHLTRCTDPGVKHLDYAKPPGGANELGFQISKMSGVSLRTNRGVYIFNTNHFSPFLKIFLDFFQIVFKILFYSRNLQIHIRERGRGLKNISPSSLF